MVLLLQNLEISKTDGTVVEALLNERGKMCIIVWERPIKITLPNIDIVVYIFVCFGLLFLFCSVYELDCCCVRSQ